MQKRAALRSDRFTVYTDTAKGTRVSRVHVTVGVSRLNSGNVAGVEEQRNEGEEETQAKGEARRRREFRGSIHFPSLTVSRFTPVDLGIVKAIANVSLSDVPYRLFRPGYQPNGPLSCKCSRIRFPLDQTPGRPDTLEKNIEKLFPARRSRIERAFRNWTRVPLHSTRKRRNRFSNQASSNECPRYRIDVHLTFTRGKS